MRGGQQRSDSRPDHDGPRVNLGKLAAVIMPMEAKGQCEAWDHAFGAAPGVGKFVRAAALWDADGPGPEPTRLVVAGDGVSQTGAVIEGSATTRLVIRSITSREAGRYEFEASDDCGSARAEVLLNVETLLRRRP